MGNTAIDTKIDYQSLEKQRTEALQAQLDQQLTSRQTGRDHSLRRAVLRYVVTGEYEEAVTVIDEYLQFKSSYPAMDLRARAHVVHAKDLINAIRAKRNFPNLSQLSMTKQQEILDHALSHFEELKNTLRSIEHIAKDEAVKDIRSTVWVIKSFVILIAAVVGTKFILEFSDSFGIPFWSVFNEFVDLSFKTIIRFIPFL